MFCISYFQFLLGPGNEGTPGYNETQEEMPTTGDGLTKLNVTVSPPLPQVILRVINSIALKFVMNRSIYWCISSGKRACPLRNQQSG